MSIIQSIFGRRKTKAASPEPSGFIFSGFEQGRANWTPATYENYVKNGLKASDIIYACISYIADSVARAYLRFEEKRGKDRVPLEKHPLITLWDRPNPLQSQTQFIGEMVYHMFLAGDFYGWKWRASNGDVLQIWPLRPDRVAPVYGGPNLIDYWEYRIGGNKAVRIPFEDLLHIPLGFHGTKPGLGMSPMETILRQADIDMEITEVVKVFLENHGVIPGIISVDPSVNEEDRKRMEKQWANRKRQHGRTPFVNGEVKFEKIALTLQELDTSALNNITDTAICRAFRIPPILVITRLGLERATYANYQQAHEAFWSDRVDPLCDLIADVIYRDIRLEYDIDTIEPIFDKSKVLAYQAKIIKEREQSRLDFDKGLLTVNEMRSELGKAPIEGGDVRMVDFSKIAVGPDAPEYEPEPSKPTPDDQPNRNDEDDDEDDEDEAAKGRAPMIVKSRADRLHEFKRRANLRPRHADRLMPYLERAWRAEFAKEKGEVIAAIRKSTKAINESDLNALLAELGYTWTQRGQGILAPALTNAGKSGLTVALQEIGIDKTPQGSEQILAQAIQQRTILSAADIPKTTLEKVRMQLAHGIAEGFGTDKIARNIAGMMDVDSPRRARMIAHTEVMNAYNAAAQAGYKSIGVTTKEWMVTEDDVLCDYCMSMDGKTVGIDGVFVSGGDEVAVTVGEVEARLGITRDIGYPPLHPYCRCDIIPGTEEFFE